LPGTNTLAYFSQQEEGFITLAPALLPFLEASSSLEPFLAAAEMAPGAAFRSWSRMPRFSGIKGHRHLIFNRTAHIRHQCRKTTVL